MTYCPFLTIRGIGMAPTWTLLSPATSPPARTGPSMTFDPATGQLILFGGLGSKWGS